MLLVLSQHKLIIRQSLRLNEQTRQSGGSLHHSPQLHTAIRLYKTGPLGWPSPTFPTSVVAAGCQDLVSGLPSVAAEIILEVFVVDQRDGRDSQSKWRRWWIGGSRVSPLQVLQVHLSRHDVDHLFYFMISCKELRSERSWYVRRINKSQYQLLCIVKFWEVTCVITHTLHGSGISFSLFKLFNFWFSVSLVLFCLLALKKIYTVDALTVDSKTEQAWTFPFLFWKSSLSFPAECV